MQKRTFGEQAIEFYETLVAPATKVHGVTIMNPYRDSAVRGYIKTFFATFFNDDRPRVLVFGINPGRFGSGVTGINFTDPVALDTFCGIPNDLPKVREQSSRFIYQFIEEWGGPKKFYRNFFLTAVVPLGFTKSGVNYNYYDDPVLYKAVKPFIVKSIRQQIAMAGAPEVAIILGTGKNKKIFDALNSEYGFFEKVYALEHPRFIMQYRRSTMAEYLKKYRETFTAVLET